MRSIPAKGAIPPALRKRGSAATRPTRPGLRGTEPSRARAPFPPIKTWTFEEKPTFKRLPARLHVTRVHQPDIDVYEEVRQLVVIANLPGVEREHLDIDVHGDIMAIEATRNDSSGQVHHYHRELLLPVVVNDIPVGVAFDDGVLEVRLKPKGSNRQAGEQ